jgi:hypothetical protein
MMAATTICLLLFLLLLLLLCHQLPPLPVLLLWAPLVPSWFHHHRHQPKLALKKLKLM